MTDKKGSLEQLNESVIDNLSEMAQSLRTNILDLSGAVLRNQLFKDILDHEFASESREFKYWVTREQAVRPGSHTDSDPSCLAFMLEGPNRFRNRKERLKILSPVPKEFDPDSLSEIAELPDPDLIYVERAKIVVPGRVETIGRYLVSREVSMPYGADEEHESRPDVSFEETDERVPEDLGGLSRILRDMANWDTKPQRKMMRTMTGMSVTEDL